MFKILDVGCGIRPKGDVNVDLFPSQTIHRTDKSTINFKRIKNFVLCDGQYLPFADHSFEKVYSSHAIEHVDKPVLFLRELVRVSKTSSDKRKRLRIIVICPHRYGRVGFHLHQCSAHINFLSVKWFNKVLKNYQHKIKTKMRFVPSELIPLFRWPHEIIVKIYK